MVKNEKFQCPSERGGPENFKNHPTFVPSAIFGGVMASQNMVNFFLGLPVHYEKRANEVKTVSSVVNGPANASSNIINLSVLPDQNPTTFINIAVTISESHSL